MKKIKDLIDNNNTPEKILLIAHALGRDKEFVLTRPEHRPNLWKRIKIRYYFYLLGHGYSVAVIVRRKEFFGLDFYVNKNVLIPRPDTEIMVEKVLAEIKNTDTLIDVGTGSGCILISILKNKNIVQAYGLDISPKALRVSRKNAKKHKVKIKLLKSNLIAKWHKIKITGDIFITANLPYLTATQFLNSPSIQREPRRALVADAGGLGLYEKLLKQISFIKDLTPCHPCLSAGRPSEAQRRRGAVEGSSCPNCHPCLSAGRPTAAQKERPHLSSRPQPRRGVVEGSSCKINLFLEIDPSQTEKIKSLIKKHLPSAEVIIIKDLSGQDRLVVVKIKK